MPEPIVVGRESTTGMSVIEVDPNGWEFDDVLSWVETHEGEVTGHVVDGDNMIFFNVYPC